MLRHRHSSICDGKDRMLRHRSSAEELPVFPLILPARSSSYPGVVALNAAVLAFVVLLHKWHTPANASRSSPLITACSTTGSGCPPSSSPCILTPYLAGTHKHFSTLSFDLCLQLNIEWLVAAPQSCSPCSCGCTSSCLIYVGDTHKRSKTLSFDLCLQLNVEWLPPKLQSLQLRWFILTATKRPTHLDHMRRLSLERCTSSNLQHFQALGQCVEAIRNVVRTCVASFLPLECCMPISLWQVKLGVATPVMESDNGEGEGKFTQVVHYPKR
eukprot:189233-Pelagomonas_calceolata.AAC.11